MLSAGSAYAAAGKPAVRPLEDDALHSVECPHQAEARGLCGRAWSTIKNWTPVGPGALGGLAGGGADNSFDVLHYALTLEIIPGGSSLSGTNVITCQSMIDGLTAVGFQLDDAFTISSVQVNGSNAAWSRLDPVNLNINLGSTFNTGQQFTVTIAYSGVPDQNQGFGSIDFTSQGGQPLISSLSEPWYAHTWWPVKEDSNDKATADLHFIVPNSLVVASNGRLQGTDVVAGGKLKYRWKTDYPTSPYLVCFSATNYAQFSDTWIYGGDIVMPMQFFIYPGSNTAGNRTEWLKTNGMLSVFSDKYGVYPFADEKYGIYQFPFGGGMEHQTMTGQGTFSEDVTSHELGHQWWGDMITCGTWHDIWLNEGFASYSEAIWREFRPGSSGTPALISYMNGTRKPSSYSNSTYIYNISNPGNLFATSNVYSKGAWILHMLRHIMGDRDFFNTLALYRANHQYGTAVTDDFEAAAEAASGLDLTLFFDQWVMQPGGASFAYASQSFPAAGQTWVEVYVNQTQDAAYPTYDMPVDIRTTISGVDSTHVIRNNERTEWLIFPVSGTPSSVVLDPDSYILTINKGTTPFVNGPPKVVALTPAPGTQADEGAVSSVAITFHKAVNAPPAQFSLVGSSSGAIPFTFNYNGTSKTATLTPTVPLEPDTYTVTVGTGVTETVGFKPLDGEMANPASPTSLPSGDGRAGGAMVMTFEIVGVGNLPGDVDGDGDVDIDDFSQVVLQWNTPCPGCSADLDDDGDVDIDDYSMVILNWTM